jgi:hypothetical protein
MNYRVNEGHGKSFEICGDLMGLSGLTDLDRHSPAHSCRSADAPTPPGLLQFYQAPAPVAAKRRFGYTGAKVRAFRLEKRSLR